MTQEEKKLPDELEEAAEEYAYGDIPNGMKSALKPIADEVIKNFIAGAEWQKAKMLEWAKERYQQTISNVGCYTGHSVWTEVIEHINEM